MRTFKCLEDNAGYVTIIDEDNLTSIEAESLEDAVDKIGCDMAIIHKDKPVTVLVECNESTIRIIPDSNRILATLLFAIGNKELIKFEQCSVIKCSVKIMSAYLYADNFPPIDMAKQAV